MQKNLNKIILSLQKKENLNREILSQTKRKNAGSFGIPTNTLLLQAYHKLSKRGKITESPTLERLLKKREIRTLSGVAPIAVLTKPYPCPGKCIYCPTESGMPKSYLSNEPAVMRAILNKFDPYKQIQMRLKALKANGHPIDKCELIIMGGTWSYLPKSYQTNFIKRCFQAFNQTNQHESDHKSHKSRIRNSCNSRIDSCRLVDKQNSWQQTLKDNEHAKHKVIGLTLETRPDYITPKEILRMRKYGCTRVELGVQSIYDDILKLNQRGGGRADIINATRLLKNAGFKITYHMMPNLPGSTPSRDLKMFKELFTNPDFQPDQLKIYPCVVTKNSKLYSQLEKNKNSQKTIPPLLRGGIKGGVIKYQPYTQKQLTNLLIKIKKIIPPYVRITRLIRDIPSESIIAGNKISNLRQYIQKEMAQKKLKCRCIRCREIRGTDYKISNVKLKKREYSASEGKEIFLSYEDTKQNKIIAFLRLRLPTEKSINNQQLTINNSAIIREVHTYGSMIPVGQSGKVEPGRTKSRRMTVMTGQHRGFGKKLTKQAETITRQAGFNKLIVISGIGVRDYYRKLGYHLKDEYMVKTFDKKTIDDRIINNK
ncbi:tRNA uridine(34) 5-carboxymethylaminomethyl modification radical SAM/GNAT enzyme Elp3 [Candidatus Falkowbacteria bacterium]|nr:tRNA uridine(34) 5-carboxymethylaminomethyl modification radical SAM/GNAT enzyme Elp3 [Candidatus Falkowbacteria bacterium]